MIFDDLVVTRVLLYTLHLCVAWIEITSLCLFTTEAVLSLQNTKSLTLGENVFLSYMYYAQPWVGGCPQE